MTKLRLCSQRVISVAKFFRIINCNLLSILRRSPSDLRPISNIERIQTLRSWSAPSEWSGLSIAENLSVTRPSSLKLFYSASPIGRL